MKTLNEFKRVSTAELNKKVYQYIIDSIDADGYDLEKEPETDKDKLTLLYNCFKSEYLHDYNLKQYGNPTSVFKEWLQGLGGPMKIVFTYFDIINLAKDWGVIPVNATEKQAQKICDDYFHFIAVKTFQLFGKHNINK